MILGGVFFFGHWCLNKLERSFSYAVRRFVSLILTTTVCVLVVYLFLTHTLYFKFAVAIYYFLSAVCFLCLLAGLSPVSYLYKMHDYVVGHFIFLLIGILSMFQVPFHLFTWCITFENIICGDIPKYLNNMPSSLIYRIYSPNYRLVTCRRGYCITMHCLRVL